MSSDNAKTGRAIKVFCGTWNMGNAKGESIQNFVPPNGKDFDIIAIGLQESTYSVGDDVKDTASEGCIKHLGNEFATILGKDFFVLEHARRAQMQLYVYARTNLQSAISHIEKSAENTGFLHIFPNKGGLCVCFHLDGTKLAFISCHLAAHEGAKKCAIRNSSVKEILGGVRAGDHRYDVAVQSHHAFFMGDMNYRLDSKRSESSNALLALDNNKNRPTNVVVVSEKIEDDRDTSEDEATPPQDQFQFRTSILQLIASEKWSELLYFDELERELAAGRLLPGFKSAVPAFPPTFKRIRNLGIEKLIANEENDLQYNLTRRVEAVPKIEFDKSSKSVAKNYTGELIRLSEKSKERRGSEKNTSPLDLSQIQLSNNNNNNNSNSKCETENSTVLTDKDTNSDSTGTSANIPNFYDKKRIPSYTDRVLYKSLPGFMDNMKLSEFYSCENVPSSDHKPVVCAFELKTTDGGVNIQKSKKGTGLSVEIYDLRGFNLAEMDSVLGAAAGSDPYVLVTSDPEFLVTEPVKTSTKTHDLNPVWDDIIVIKLNSNDLVGLSHIAHLSIAVWDWDRFTQHDVIGVCFVSLKDIIETFSNHHKHKNRKDKPPSYHSFDLPIHFNGCVNGRLEGKIRLPAGVDVETLAKQLENDLLEDLKPQNTPAGKNKMSKGCASCLMA